MPTAHKFVKHVIAANASDHVATEEAAEDPGAANVAFIQPIPPAMKRDIQASKLIWRICESLTSSPTAANHRINGIVRDCQVLPHKTHARHNTIASAAKH
jgi:hypothetical protein